ncbi:MAG: MerR family transcriptional regulator [Brumimicrobium sp.]|nr:MerR family transcriptional regulator [Brumimicrobium sp.]
MIRESELTKLYYSIGEVAKMFDVNASLIRFWEKEFPSVQPKKNKKGNRLFSPKNVLELQRIYQLVKIDGHTLEGAKKALKTTRTIDNSDLHKDNQDIIERLRKIKNELVRLKK